MGNLTDDMTRLRGEMDALRHARGALMHNLAQGAGDLAGEVASLLKNTAEDLEGARRVWRGPTAAEKRAARQAELKEINRKEADARRQKVEQKRQEAEAIRMKEEQLQREAEARRLKEEQLQREAEAKRQAEERRRLAEAEAATRKETERGKMKMAVSPKAPADIKKAKLSSRSRKGTK